MIATGAEEALWEVAAARRTAPVAGLGELFQRQADDARALSGARTSAWNGTVQWLPREGRPDPLGVVGIADWDGTIYYDRAYVERPLQTLFEKAAGGLEGYQLYRAKNALAVVLHENCHLLGSEVGDHEITKARWSLPLVVLEEGSTELFTRTRLDAYVRRLGLDRIAPGLKEVEIQGGYPLFVPAVQILTQGIGRLTRQSGSQVLRKMICEAGGKKFQTLGGIVLDGSGLAARMPGADRAPVAAEIGEVVSASFGDVARLGPLLTPETSFKVSRRVGREALRGILSELEKLDARYPNVDPQGAPARMPPRFVLPLGMAPSPAPRRGAPLRRRRPGGGRAHPLKVVSLWAVGAPSARLCCSEWAIGAPIAQRCCPEWQRPTCRRPPGRAGSSAGRGR